MGVTINTYSRKIQILAKKQTVPLKIFLEEKVRRKNDCPRIDTNQEKRRRLVGWIA